MVCIKPANGRTSVDVEDELVTAFLKMMGEPRAWAMAASGQLVMLFPHQDMPENVRDIAEQMTTHHLIRRLETVSMAVS